MPRFLTLAVALLCASLLPVSQAAAESATFDFKDPKGVNGVSFVVDSTLEPIVGIVGGVAGSVDYDPADPESITGHISVDAATISLINPGMTKALLGDGWLEAEGEVPITFHFGKVTNVADSDNSKTLTVEGKLTLGQLEIPKTVEVAVTHIKDGAKARGGAKAGDLLVIRSMFKVDRGDLGLKPDMDGEKVGRSIGVFVPIVGYSK